MADQSRKWALTKLGVGDYLLPSNSGRTVWRITRSEGEGWDLFRWIELDDAEVDTTDWARWECVAQLVETRRDAIVEAMRLGDSRG